MSSSEEEIINTEEDLRRTLGKISFAPSCVDMEWEWKIERLWGATVFDPANPVPIPTFAGWNISTTFVRPDRDTGRICRGEGRRWFIHVGISESGLVKTCFKAALLILEHELMESFKYAGMRPFDPHHSIDTLCKANIIHESINRG